MQLKKILPLFAIAIGLALAMATSGFREGPETVFSFVFVAPGGTDFSDDAVMDEANWDYTSDNNQCTGFVKACKITTGSSYVTGSSPATYALDPSISVQASENGAGVARVTGIADQTGSYSNKN